ncbi:MAG: hypothetical protein Q7U12_15505 [Undibacterium sp.]|nr:hypothetical protein [Undibacterium sp.]
MSLKSGIPPSCEYESSFVRNTLRWVSKFAVASLFLFFWGAFSLVADVPTSSSTSFDAIDINATQGMVVGVKEVFVNTHIGMGNTTHKEIFSNVEKNATSGQLPFYLITACTSDRAMTIKALC